MDDNITDVAKEQKYFISYVAYKDNRTDFLNDIIYIDEEITIDIIIKVEEDLLNRLKENYDGYFGVQIINLNQLLC